MSNGQTTGPRPRPFLPKGRVDLILAISAIFISAMSLLVAIRTERSQRDTLAADIWPFLQRTIDVGDTAIEIGNDGVGPAKIRSVELFYDGKPVSSARDLLRRCCGYRGDAPGAQTPFATSLANNIVLRAGDRVSLIRIKPTPEARQLHEGFRATFQRLSFRGCYCSVLDQCWTSDLSSIKTQQVAACPAPEHPFDPRGN